MQSFRPVVSRGRFCPAGCRCGGYAAGALLGWLCRLGLGRVRGPSSRVGAFVLPGAAAAAIAAGTLLRWLRRLGLGRVRGPSSRVGRFCPAGCRCGGFAAGTLLAWLCRLGLGRVRGPSSRVGASVLMGVAAAAMPPGRSWLGCAAWVWAGYLACISRWCVYPVGCCCGGYAAGDALGLAVPL